MSNIITQNIKFRESVVKFAIKHNNNSIAARKYKLTREYVRFWRSRYDGTLDSLQDKSKAQINPINKHLIHKLILLNILINIIKVSKPLKCLLLLKEKVIYIHITHL